MTQENDQAAVLSAKVNKLVVKWSNFSVMQSEVQESLQDTLQSLLNELKVLQDKVKDKDKPVGKTN